MNTVFRSALSVATLCLFAHAAQAAPIALFNTGVDAAGVAVANGTLGDAHYSLISAPAGSTLALRALTSSGGYPIGPWTGDNTRSTWIGPNNDADATGPTGNYVFRTTFTLVGFDASTASIAGGWATDNGGTDILINGVSLGFQTPNNSYQLGFSNFSISSGFVSGVNTIDFVVNNSAPSPVGLRVEMTGTANAVPEPTSLALAGLALLGVAAVRRKAA